MVYDIKALAAINERFIFAHLALTDSDVAHANHMSKLIEQTRNSSRPMPGDIVEFTNRYGEYYRNTHIENVDENELHICEEPYIPFVKEANGNIYFSTSGGVWGYISRNLKRIGTRPKCFKDWGHCGVCADGAVDFFAEVNVWEYVEPNPFFGSYTTKDYCKQFISYDPKDSSPWGYHYYGDGHAYRTEKQYLAWLTTYYGVEFEGFWENQTVVFHYRKNELLISKDEWNALELPTDTRMMNGTIIDIKFHTDEETHTIFEYRYTNISEDCDSCRYRRPYEVALSRIKREEISRKILPKTNERK